MQEKKIDGLFWERGSLWCRNFPLSFLAQNGEVGTEETETFDAKLGEGEAYIPFPNLAFLSAVLEFHMPSVYEGAVLLHKLTHPRMLLFGYNETLWIILTAWFINQPFLFFCQIQSVARVIILYLLSPEPWIQHFTSADIQKGNSLACLPPLHWNPQNTLLYRIKTFNKVKRWHFILLSRFS